MVATIKQVNEDLEVTFFNDTIYTMGFDGYVRNRTREDVPLQSYWVTRVLAPGETYVFTIYKPTFTAGHGDWLFVTDGAGNPISNEIVYIETLVILRQTLAGAGLGAAVGGATGYFLGEPMGPIVSELVGAGLAGLAGGVIGWLTGTRVIPLPTIGEVAKKVGAAGRPQSKTIKF